MRSAAEALLIGVGEDDLAHGGSRLLLLQPVRAALEAERATAQCYGTRGDDDHLPAPAREAGNVGGKAVEPAVAHAAVLVGKQGAADLDDEPPGLKGGRDGHAHVAAARR